MTVAPATLELAPEAGFESFVNAHQTQLRRHAYALAGNGPDADDLLQATLVKLFLAWGRIEGQGHPTAYARTTMARTYVSAWRRWGRHESPVASPPETASPGSDATSDRDLIWRGLERLGRRQRAVVVLRYYDDLDLAAIAETLGVSVGTVKSQLSRALANLRETLGDDPQ
jgi:RNA polymerase sigma-70 factor (sigma-E family)